MPFFVALQMTTEDNNTVRVYNVADQTTGELVRVAAKAGISHEDLGGYIAVVLATHLSMSKKPTNVTEMDELVKALGQAATATLADSVARMIAMIKERRLNYYNTHRRDFIPESVCEASKERKSKEGVGANGTAGKYSDRLDLSEYITAPMSEADMTYALTHMMGFAGSNVSILRSSKQEPQYFSQPTSTGFNGAEEQRAAIIQQRAFFGSTVFVETSKVREHGDYSLTGSKSMSTRADGKSSVHDTGAGLTTHCFSLSSHLKGLDAGAPVGNPFIVDVGGKKGVPLANVSGSVFENTSPHKPPVLAPGRGHHVCAMPVCISGRKQIIVFDCFPRKSSYKSEGLIYPAERCLADAYIETAFVSSPSKYPPQYDYTEQTVHSKAFTSRRCKLCNVIHSSDMHAEFQ